MGEAAGTRRETSGASGRPAAFPAPYIDSFYAAIAAPDSGVRVLTYADLDFDGDWDYEHNYPGERAAWERALAAGEIDPSKVYLMLQHDVDTAPELTHRMLRVQEGLGIRSTVMVFNRLVDRSRLKREGVVSLLDYELDHNLLSDLERRGWVVGYHANAYEQAAFDTDQAERIFAEDVAALRERHTIDFFCPHGGARDAEGKSNVHFGIPPAFRTSVRWTLNLHTPKFDGIFSDGGLAGRRDAPDRLDLRTFIAKWRPGKRYRMLIHPQYYGERYAPIEALQGQEWYREVHARGDVPNGYADWWTIGAAAAAAQTR